MSKNKIVYIIVLSLLLLTFPVLADSEETASYGAQMVASGMEIFANSISDSMYQLGNGSAPVNRSESPGTLFKIITYTVDPYSFEWVHTWQNTMMVAYVIFGLLALFVSSSFVLWSRLSPSFVDRITWITGSTGDFNFDKWKGTIILMFILPVAVLFGVYVLIYVNFVISSFLTAKGLSAIPLVADNIIAYFFMALTFLIMSLVMFARNIIIVLFVAGSLGLAALYLFDDLRDAIKSLFMYFIVVLFMQPVIIFVAILGLLFLKNLPPALFFMESTGYLVLSLILIVIGVVCIVGLGIVKTIIGVRIWRM